MTKVGSLLYSLTLALGLLMSAVVAVAQDAPSGLYTFNDARPEAVTAYRRGWVEILEFGRWQEAERQYRKALSIDPDFVIAMSVLARLLPSGDERRQLEQDIRSHMHRVDEDGRLLLDAYVKTLELMNARDLGQPVSMDLREDLRKRAVSNYREFLFKYPGEWSVLIEYVEWIHASSGPQGALEAVAELTSQSVVAASRGFSYFPAYFHAELDQLEQATTLADEFAQRLPKTELPQPHYVRAFIALRASDLELAKTEIDKALSLDSKHILAQRLKAQIDAAVAAQSG
ncbi:MAG: hypothetical protein AB8B57_14570 [Congregibacter sp.]